MLKGFAIICLFLAAGMLLAQIPGMPMPAGVNGMLLLCLGLQFRLVKLGDVKKVADGLIQVLPLLFVPPGVGLMLYPDLLAKYGTIIAVASVVSAVLVMAATGKVFEWLSQKLK